MSPVLFGWYVACGVVGFYSPFLMVKLIKTFLRSIDAFCSQLKVEHDYRRLMKPEYWHFQKVVQCPNPDYISIHFMHSGTREIISLGIEKLRIRGYI